jgi:hypothetical protein
MTADSADALAARHAYNKQALLMDDNRNLRAAYASERKAFEDTRAALDKAEAGLARVTGEAAELRRRVAELESSKPPQLL